MALPVLWWQIGIWIAIDLALLLMSPSGSNWSRRRYWVRLVRTEMYTVAASVAGGIFLSGYRSVHELLHGNSEAMRLVFGIAAGHWIVSCFEEFVTWSHALAGLDANPNQRAMLVSIYVAHHVSAATVYVYCQNSLGSLGVLGLWFEVPVTLTTLRDLWIEFGHAPLTNPDTTGKLWSWIRTLFWIGRGPAMVMYATSLLVESWRDEVARLDPVDRALYHSFGVGFIALSLGWRGMLSLWFLSDMDKSYAFARGDDVEAPHPPDSHSNSQNHVSMDEVKENGWIVIRGTVYEVPGSFEHPGGEEILARAMGTDATSSFEAVGHSVGALSNVKEIGVLVDNRESHPAEKTKTNAWATDRSVPYSYLAAHWDALPPVGAASWTHVLAGLAMRRVLPARGRLDVSALFAATLCVRNEMRTDDRDDNKSDNHDNGKRKKTNNLFAMALGVCGAAADVAIAKALTSTPFTGVRWISAHVTSLAIEAALMRTLTSLAWAVALLIVITRTSGHEAVVLGSALVVAQHATRAPASRGVRNDDDDDDDLVSSARARTIRRWAAFALSVALAFHSGDISVSFPLLTTPVRTWFVDLLRYFCAWLVWRSREKASLKLRRSSSDAFAARTHAFAAFGFSSLMNATKFQIAASVVAHGMWLVSSQRDALSDLGSAAPAHAFGWQTALDRFALTVSFCFRQLAASCISLANLVAPRGSFWYLASTPLPDIPNVDYGVALLAKGDLRGGPANSLQLNIGHLDVFPGTDALHTAYATAEMIKDLAETRQEGFVANMVAFIPDASTGALREINLSAWKSDDAAHEWYRNNSVHKTIVRRYYERGMASFSSMLGSLHPSKPFRFHARCRKCHALQTNYQIDKTCAVCGNTVRMPYF